MAKANILAVLLHVEQARLATVLAALDGAATLVSVTATSEAAAEAHPAPQIARRTKTQAYQDGVRMKGISGEELVEKVLAECNGLATFTKFAEAFKAHGFSPNSASPALSTAAQNGKVRALGGGRYAAPGTVVKMGADA
jgi:hypothetical protein